MKCTDADYTDTDYILRAAERERQALQRIHELERKIEMEARELSRKFRERFLEKCGLKGYAVFSSGLGTEQVGGMDPPGDAAFLDNFSDCDFSEYSRYVESGSYHGNYFLKNILCNPGKLQLIILNCFRSFGIELPEHVECSPHTIKKGFRIYYSVIEPFKIAIGEREGIKAVIEDVLTKEAAVFVSAIKKCGEFEEYLVSRLTSEGYSTPGEELSEKAVKQGREEDAVLFSYAVTYHRSLPPGRFLYFIQLPCPDRGSNRLVLDAFHHLRGKAEPIPCPAQGFPAQICYPVFESLEKLALKERQGGQN